jgi:hypothetical protein
MESAAGEKNDGDGFGIFLFLFFGCRGFALRDRSRAGIAFTNGRALFRCDTNPAAPKSNDTT